ncbi:MAG TPA: hypothetical protein VKS01_04300, partial [Bryobacteraceae bacterium]|nr:hypothetical protein [Bryobacteraceae bacterium]
MRRFALLIACIPLAHAADSTCSASNIEEIAKQFQQASKKHDRWRILEAAGELAERYELAGRRKSLRDLARRLEKKHWGDEMEPLRTQAKVFGGYADQTVASHAPSRLTYAYT